MSEPGPPGKEPFDTWLDTQAHGTGILAAGVLLRDRNCLTRSYSEEHPTTDLDMLWLRLTDILQSLHLCRVNPWRSLWSFEHAQLHFVVRPDGIGLGLLTVGYPMPPDPTWIEQLVTEFLNL